MVQKRSGGMSAEVAKAIRTLRARLILCRFKDMYKSDVDRYAGTSNRSSQKVLVSEAVLRGWDIFTADIWSWPS